jgi:hypothetical protein
MRWAALPLPHPAPVVAHVQDGPQVQAGAAERVLVCSVIMGTSLVSGYR